MIMIQFFKEDKAKREKTEAKYLKTMIAVDQWKFAEKAGDTADKTIQNPYVKEQPQENAEELSEETWLALCPAKPVVVQQPLTLVINGRSALNLVPHLIGLLRAPAALPSHAGIGPPCLTIVAVAEPTARLDDAQPGRASP